MRKLLIVLFTLLPLISCFSSTSNVTATITGSDGQVWSNGTYTISFWPTPGKPLSQFNVSGASFPQGPFTGVLDATGTFTVTLTDNLSINPTGSKWQFTICPNATSRCFTTQAVVTGAAPNLSAALSVFATAPVVNATPMARAYKDSQVVTPTSIGNMYYDVVNGLEKWWDGTTWQSVISGTTLPSLTVNNGGCIKVYDVTNTQYLRICNLSIEQFLAPVTVFNLANPGGVNISGAGSLSTFHNNIALSANLGGNVNLNVPGGASLTVDSDIDLTTKIGTYNNVVTEGMGVPPIVDSVSLTGQTGSIGPNNILASASAGTYRISMDGIVTTAGTAGAITIAIDWTNTASIAKTVNICTNMNGNILGVECAQSSLTQPLVIRPQAGTAVTYTVTTASTATYGIDIITEKLN